MNRIELLEVSFGFGRGFVTVGRKMVNHVAGQVFVSHVNGEPVTARVYLDPDTPEAVARAADLIRGKTWVAPAVKMLAKHAADMKTWGPRYALNRWPRIVDELRAAAEGDRDVDGLGRQLRDELGAEADDLRHAADRLERWLERWAAAMA